MTRRDKVYFQNLVLVCPFKSFSIDLWYLLYWNLVPTGSIVFFTERKNAILASFLHVKRGQSRVFQICKKYTYIELFRDNDPVTSSHYSLSLRSILPSRPVAIFSEILVGLYIQILVSKQKKRIILCKFCHI